MVERPSRNSADTVYITGDQSIAAVTVRSGVGRLTMNTQPSSVTQPVFKPLHRHLIVGAVLHHLHAAGHLARRGIGGGRGREDRGA